MLWMSYLPKIFKGPLGVASLVGHDSFGDFSWEDSSTLPLNSYIPAQDLFEATPLKRFSD